MNQEGILDSWKEIAAFFGRGVRTVQRWERSEGLPVLRHHHLKRGSVQAFPSDLIAWQGRRHNGNQSLSHHDPVGRMRSLMLEQKVLVAELKRLHVQSCLEMSRALPPRSTSQNLVVALALR